MTNHEILYRLSEKIIFPHEDADSLMCYNCPRNGHCDNIHKNECIESLTTFIHEELVEIVGGEITIKKRGKR